MPSLAVRSDKSVALATKLTYSYDTVIIVEWTRVAECAFFLFTRREVSELGTSTTQGHARPKLALEFQ